MYDKRQMNSLEPTTKHIKENGGGKYYGREEVIRKKVKV